LPEWGFGIEAVEFFLATIISGDFMKSVALSCSVWRKYPGRAASTRKCIPRRRCTCSPASRDSLALPVFGDLTAGEIERVVSAIDAFTAPA
jgi:hypothetical protein